MNVYTIADNLSQQQESKKAVRKKKIKRGLKKFGRGLSMVFAAPARGAFLALVALNLNAMASRLNFAKSSPKTKAEWQKIIKLWKKLGGRVSKLEKAIRTGQKKKPFFFSKKARRKFTAKAKAEGIKAKGINGIYAGIGEPITTAALISSAAGVLAAMVPIIMKALDKGGKKQELQKQVQEGVELRQELEQRPAVQEELQQMQPEQQAEAIEGFGYYEGIGVPALPPIPGLPTSTKSQGMKPEILTALSQGLTTLAGAGINAGMVALERKARKNPRLMGVLQRGNNAVEDYAVGQQLRKVGATDTAKQFLSATGNIPGYVWGLGAAGLLGAVLLIKKK